MSDQGDTGQWRPATSQSDQDSTPEDTTGPLPAVAGDEADDGGFPSVRPAGSSASRSRDSWSASDDDAPTGGFSAGSPPEEPALPKAPATPAIRSPFEPTDRADSHDPSSSNEAPASPVSPPEDPGFTGATPRFGTDVPAPEPKSEPPSPSFDEPWFREPSSGAKPYEAPASSYEPEDASSKPEPYREMPPPPKRHVTADDEAAENEFFAPDDHPPMWDKVVAPAGPPPKPGKPSSGNLRLPDWMRDEQNTQSGAPEGPGGGLPEYDDDEGGSKRPLIIGLGVLVAGILAAGSVYVFKHDGNSQVSNAPAPSRSTLSPAQRPNQPTDADAPGPTKPLPVFKGAHTKAIGRVNDPTSGLSYARLAKPWAAPSKKSPMTELGFSASQFAVTENVGGQPKHWASLMSAQLTGAALASYQGPGHEHAAVTDLAEIYEARMFSFRHRKKPLASQPLDVGGHKGWLVSDSMTYHRPGVKATGDVVTVVLIDTGGKSPGVLYMSVPNTDRKLWPDIDFVIHSLRVG